MLQGINTLSLTNLKSFLRDMHILPRGNKKELVSLAQNCILTVDKQTRAAEILQHIYGITPAKPITATVTLPSSTTIPIRATTTTTTNMTSSSSAIRTLPQIPHKKKSSHKHHHHQSSRTTTYNHNNNNDSLIPGVSDIELLPTLPPVPLHRVQVKEIEHSEGLVATCTVLGGSWAVIRSTKFTCYIPETYYERLSTSVDPSTNPLVDTASTRLFVRFAMLDSSIDAIQFPSKWPSKILLRIGEKIVFDTTNDFVAHVAPRPAVDITHEYLQQRNQSGIMSGHHHHHNSSSSNNNNHHPVAIALPIELRATTVPALTSNLRWICVVSLVTFHSNLAILGSIPRSLEVESLSRAMGLVTKHLGGSDNQENKDDDDDDIQILSATHEISLKDPISLCRIQYPVRSQLCQHIGCFDLYGYLNMTRASKVVKMKCPICNVDAPIKHLILDGWIHSIIQQTPENVKMITMTKTGQVDFQPEDDDDDNDSEGNDDDSGSDGDIPISANIKKNVLVLDNNSSNVVVIGSTPSPPISIGNSPAATAAASSKSTTASSTSTSSTKRLPAPIHQNIQQPIKRIKQPVPSNVIEILDSDDDLY
jgi:hypothetical protein